MSLLAEVLESAASVNIEDINEKVPELKGKVDTYKNEVINNVENVYVKYKNRSHSNDLLLNKSVQLQHTLSSLKEKAEFVLSRDLEETDQQVKRNIMELRSVEFALQVVLHLLNCIRLLEDFDLEMTVYNYLKCVEIIKQLNEKLEGIPIDERLEVVDELYRTVKEKYLSLQNDLKNVFTDNIQVIENPEEKKISLKIQKSNDHIKNAMLALYNDTEEVYPLKCLAKDIWNLLVSVVDNVVELDETEDGTFISLHLSVKDAKKKSDYKTVFDNLKIVLEFLMRNFNYRISDELSVLGYIGDDIRDNLSELIIKHCLRETIPSTTEELQNYKVVIEDTQQLEKALLDADIFKTNTASILEYASNVDILFINKKCEEYLKTATEIMKKDLHDMVNVGVPYDPEYPLGKEVLVFPQCCISKNVQELLDFCTELLEKSIQASPENSGRLYVTVTNILLKYRTFVPDYHRNYLASLPQQIALFLNNCRYISHVLVEWNQTYCVTLQATLVQCNFTDESNKFPLVGFEMFSDYIEGQTNQINEIMSGARLDGLTLEKLDPITEKCVRQCLRQQELLRTVWHKVLPYNLYNENIGIIVDTLCKSIIEAVVKFEDISAAAAEQLVDIIKLVLTRASKLFINPNEVTLFVPSWYKLKELSFVLNSSLVDINDRWADGKGPLAMQFEGTDLKQLIKALFQNTDRRAAVLAKISECNP